MTITPGGQGDSPILRYEIQIREDDDTDADTDDPESDWAGATTVVPTPPNNPVYFHSNVKGGQAYVYRARAFNATGHSNWSAVPANATAETRAPGMITLTATTTGSSQVLLEWNKPQANGSDIDGYTFSAGIPQQLLTWEAVVYHQCDRPDATHRHWDRHRCRR